MYTACCWYKSTICPLLMVAATQSNMLLVDLFIPAQPHANPPCQQSWPLDWRWPWPSQIACAQPLLPTKIWPILFIKHLSNILPNLGSGILMAAWALCAFATCIESMLARHKKRYFLSQMCLVINLCYFYKYSPFMFSNAARR